MASLFTSRQKVSESIEADFRAQPDIGVHTAIYSHHPLLTLYREEDRLQIVLTMRQLQAIYLSIQDGLSAHGSMPTLDDEAGMHRSVVGDSNFRCIKPAKGQ